jgi:hypothetical protein
MLSTDRTCFRGLLHEAVRLKAASYGGMPVDPATYQKHFWEIRRSAMAAWSSWKHFIPISFCNGHSLICRSCWCRGEETDRHTGEDHDEKDSG